jgi:SAM-dependent methyltransferase
MRSELPNATATNRSFEFSALQHARNYRAALIHEFAPFLQGRLIEIGAGIGQMTELLALIPKVEYVLGVEPDEVLCANFKERLPRQPLLRGTVESIPKGESWNAIVSINVLEHIGEDERELKFYSEILSPQRGFLCLFVPAGPGIYAPLDRAFGHFRRYSKSELKTKLECAGFELLRLSYFNFLGYFAWWLNFCVLRKLQFDSRAVRFFDGALLPIVLWLERHISAPPFGQSLIAVARPKTLRVPDV